ncbi:MAG: MXAN_6640 family putative metalloprotease, partial [Gaiellaceae bacterium]
VERPARRDATLYLRDLAARKGELTGPERQLAEALLARPDDQDVPIGNGWTVTEAAGSPVCSALPGTGVCVHWVDSTSDAPSPDDVSPANSVPDWVDLTLATWENAWAQEIAAIGYRAPLPDGVLGDDNRLDVYIDDLGVDAVFGYCTSDDPGVDVPGDFDIWAYCVVDDDYAPGQFGTAHTPLEFLQVTSAHEFNHASQFAYDWLEDVWLLEGTATNMEETVYPDVDDNVSFLRGLSPLSVPGSPLDRGGFFDSEYGAWIFWRFLEETIAGDDPTIVREVWERADASAGAAFGDQYSLQAARTELAQRGHVFRNAFARFVTANRLRDYDDAATAGYPVPPRTAAYSIGPKNRSIPRRSWKIGHLAARFFSFQPSSGGPANARLRLAFQLPRYGARATVVVVNRNGTMTHKRLNQSASGRISWGAPFGRRQVARVHLVLSNGSVRTSCWRSVGPPSYSCLGRPLDDGRVFRFTAQLVRL